ncbi:UPF0711 protein C18orf21 homolog [Clupea harengus]|uniref:UPF0711 protein C18orf21 homolog n=1 Tax=Clupea harengus TaxID=7950 RepID=A0A6P3VYX7_CLUHA|nr:UPF0711 protein C18orf21 homolog [Clupea harengus]
MDKDSFLKKASLLYKDSCPELSRFLMQTQQMNGSKSSSCVEKLCPFCFQWREPDNHRVRLRPKRRPSAHLQRLLGREAKGRKLRLEESDALCRFRRSSSCLMATCHTCNKTSRTCGPNRDFLTGLVKNPSTPRNAGKRKNPQSTSKGSMSTPSSASSQKSPFSTPRTVSSDSTSSSKSSSVKKSAFSRLKKLLSLEDSPKTKKGGLKDFLSAL